MAGFELPKRDARITFEGHTEECGGEAKCVEQEHAYHGAEVFCRLSVPLGLYLDMLDAAGDQKRAREINEKWAEEALVSWNVTKNGEPVPATPEGLLSADPEFVTLIVTKWAETIGSVPDPLEEPSPVTGS